jgi:hypothetical protein
MVALLAFVSPCVQIGMITAALLYLPEYKMTLLHSVHFLGNCVYRPYLTFDLSFTVDELRGKLFHDPVNTVIN